MPDGGDVRMRVWRWPRGHGDSGGRRREASGGEAAPVAKDAKLPQDAGEAAPQEAPAPQEGKAALAARQIDRWIAQMEQLRLAEYVRYADDKRRVFWSNFLGGVARGVGMAVGFTILGAILVLILQDLAKHNLPVIGDALAQIVSIVQKRLE